MEQIEVERLRDWFKSNARTLPWRESSTPYAVWVSEVMLQQTRVSVVIPYFERWMQRFPSVFALASAPCDEVIKLWEGLGYYSRARALHSGAQEVVEKYEGELPASYELLLQIKGIGPYTAGAILSFAFHQKQAAVDGNVLRVIARYYQIDEDISRPAAQKEIRERVEALLPNKEPWVVSEALIELGATHCSKKSNCMSCPVRGGCMSFCNRVVDEYPKKRSGEKCIPLYRALSLIQCEDSLLLGRVGKGKVMSDLHEFPYYESGPTAPSPGEQLIQTQQAFHLDLSYVKTLPSVIHHFTKYKATLFVQIFKTPVMRALDGYFWATREEIFQLALSSGHRRVYQQLLADSTSEFGFEC